MCPRTCALGLSSSLLSENKKKTTKVCEIGDRESYFGALFILWIHGKNSHIRTTCKLGGHDLRGFSRKKKIWLVSFVLASIFSCLSSNANKYLFSLLANTTSLSNPWARFRKGTLFSCSIVPQQKTWFLSC